MRCARCGSGEIEAGRAERAYRCGRCHATLERREPIAILAALAVLALVLAISPSGPVAAATIPAALWLIHAGESLQLQRDPSLEPIPVARSRPRAL